MKRSLLFGCVTLLTLFCGGFSEAKEKDIPIQILGVNDFHGNLDTTGTLYMPDSKKIYDAGGAAKLATTLNNQESKFHANYHTNKKQTVRIEAGDLVGASPASSSLLQDEPTIKIFNAMNFRIGTLGNHEFDEGLDEFHRILIGAQPSEEVSDIVQNYPQQKSHLTMISSNLIDRSSGNIPYDWKPYTIMTIKSGVKIGFIGIDTSDLPQLVLSKYTKNYRVLDAAKQITKYSKELRDEGVHAICVVAHTSSTQGTTLKDCETKQIIDKVQQLDPHNSIDIYLAAHNHVTTNATYKGIRIVQAASQGKAVSDIRGLIDTKTKDFIKQPDAEIIPVLSDTKEDIKVKQIVDDAKKRISPIINQVISTTETHKSISKNLNSQAESELADLITTAQLTEANKEIPTDFAITNNGSIRNDLKTNEDGEITWGAAQSVQPFGNDLHVIQLSGDDLYKLMKKSLEKEDHSSLQIAGFKMIYKVINGKRELIKLTKDDDEPIESNQQYQVAVNDFIYTGGDGYTELNNKKDLGIIGTDTEVFINYLKENNPIKSLPLDRKIEF